MPNLNWMKQISTILVVFFSGSLSAQQVTAPGPVADKNKDVVLLALLIKDHLTDTRERDVVLSEILQLDTTGRITGQFEEIQMKSNKGYISVYFKFSATRVDKDLQLTADEKKMLGWIRYKQKDLPGNYDGEMQFNFGERFYRIRRITVKKE
jgi:hypothetical protein